MISIAGAADSQADARRPVVIYYANETTWQAAGSENYAGLLSILKRSPNPLAGRIADSILHDAAAFPNAVRKHVAAMAAAARRGDFDLAVFTNELALDGAYSFYRQGMEAAETRHLPALPPSTGPILTSAPLSRVDYLRAALFEIGALYPPDGVDAFLIVNTHGAADLALAPRVFADISLARADELLAAIDGGGSATAGTPRWAAVRGTDKVDFWKPLADAGARYGMRFPLVFREACASGISGWHEFFALPENVDVIAHTGMRDIDYDDIDYGAIFAGTTERQPLSVFISGALRERRIEVQTRGAIGLSLAYETAARHYYLFFVPLGLWLLWLIGWPLRRGGGNVAPSS